MSEPKTAGVPIPDPSRSQNPAAGAGRGFWGWLWALLGQRCPRCRKGQIFRGFTMNDPCPVCGLIFQREEGYFLGAMYVSYVLSGALIIPFYLVAAALLPGQNSLVIAAAAMIPYLPFIPTVFCYSRVIWIYFERAMCPSDVSAGPYEKLRQRQLAQRRAGRQ
jgi:uncharacterized protein (DUF983 family)